MFYEGAHQSYKKSKTHGVSSYDVELQWIDPRCLSNSNLEIGVDRGPLIYIDAQSELSLNSGMEVGSSAAIPRTLSH